MDGFYFADNRIIPDAYDDEHVNKFDFLIL